MTDASWWRCVNIVFHPYAWMTLFQLSSTNLVTHGLWLAPTILIVQYLIASGRDYRQVPLPTYEAESVELSGISRVAFSRAKVSYPPKKSTAHTHPDAARDRSAAITFIKNFILSTGRRPYSVSMSASDMRDPNVDGCRHYYFEKDYLMPTRDDDFDPDVHHLFMGDTDYYPDINDYLRAGVPLTLYTFTPSKPAGSGKDYSWHTTQDGEIMMEVNGGAVYRHQLWDYNTDHCLIYNAKEQIYIAYNVDSKATEDPNRRIVHFTPKRYLDVSVVETEIRKWRSLTLLGRLLQLSFEGNFGYAEKPIVRRNLLAAPTVAYMRTSDADGIHHHVSRTNSSACASFTDADWHACAFRFFSSDKSKAVDLEKLLGRTHGTGATHASLLMFDCFSNGIELAYRPAQTPPAPDDASLYQAVGPFLLEDSEKGGMRQLCPPLMGTAFCPARSVNNDLACKAGRLDAVQQRAPLHLPFKYTEYMHSFVGACVGDATASLHPCLLEEVEEKQSRPTQRSQRENCGGFLDVLRDKVKSFQKAEAYPKIAPPRNISNVSTENKTMLSQYTYRFYEMVFSKLPWAVSGLNPAEMVSAVRKYAAGYRELESGDISKMDGSFPHELHQVFRLLMLTCFSEQHRAELLELLEAEISTSASTAQGVKYNTGSSTLSGSPVTSMRNTSAVAFVCYCALRNMGFNHTEAWARLGKYAGDDSLQGGVPAETLAREFKKFNMEYKPNTVAHGQPLMFLGRIFLDPWTSDACIADVPRQMRKMHLSAALESVPVEIVWARKVRSILVTDPKTPLLTDFCEAVASKTRDLENQVAHGEQTPWYSTYESDVQFQPPGTPAEYELAQHIVSDACGFDSVADLEQYIDRLGHLSKHADLMDFLHGLAALRIPEPVRVEITAQVAGEIHYAEPKPVDPRPILKPVRCVDVGAALNPSITEKPEQSVLKVASAPPKAKARPAPPVKRPPRSVVRQDLQKKNVKPVG